MIIIFSLFFIVAFIFLGVDLYVSLNEWQSRIHIGRWKDRKKWQTSMERKALQWLVSLPVVKATANERFLLWDMLRGKYGKQEVQSWQMAGLLLGTGKKGAEVIAEKCNSLIPDDIDSDYLLLAYAMQKEGCLSVKQKNIVDLYLSHFLTNLETIPYRKHSQNIRFVDTIGLVVPYLMLNDMDSAAKRQIEEYDDALLNGIYPAHAFSLVNYLPLGVHDWARGIGWYALGLTENSNPEMNRIRIIKLADALLPLQQEGGGFAFFVFNPKYRMESSGTALIGLLMLSAYKLTQKDCYLESAIRIEKSLMFATRRDGTLDYCQSDTFGIGFYSTYFSRMPFAQGIALYFSKMLDSYIIKV